MLELKSVTKIYKTNDLTQKALNKVSIKFRDNEFVSILGPSGSGKTTLLNIIGGLDRYTSGDLIISGISTKKYKDRNWDTYRNHKVGFVFQSYNLISHQTALSNVELALTISGVGKKERRKRAIKVLKQVGLSDHINKKPSEMSGGQMQRVAIARALINDPDILLADEPTGALDSKTSVQIMDLLKEIARDRLVIMVTHNPELADTYSTRIVKLKDGKITDDSNPYEEKEDEIKNKSIGKKTSMSFLTAMSLSLNNLMTKKARTFLTAFAGSIGIIGIALILSLSNGVSKYIDKKEEETLSNYPLTIEKSSMDMMGMMNMMNSEPETASKGKVKSNNILDKLLTSFKMKVNNLEDFKKYLDNNKEIKKYTNDIQYTYELDINLYTKDKDSDNYKVNPSDIDENLGNLSKYMQYSDNSVFMELFDSEKMLLDNYDLVAGNLPKSYNEVLLMLDSNNMISDYALYILGLKSREELKKAVDASDRGEDVKSKVEEYSYEELLNLKYKLIINTDYYVKENNIWIDKSNDKDYMNKLYDNSEDIKIVGIVKSHDNSALSTSGSVGYTKELTNYVMDKVNNSEIVKDQKARKDINVFTNKSFDIRDLSFDPTIYSLSEAEIQSYILNMSEIATYESNLKKLGVVDINNPDIINIYPKDFNSKDEIVKIIDKYNEGKNEQDKITYNDTVGMMMKSVTSIVNIISYVLIAFVGISLVVSSIMIGIITYISVLERKKEIGILRAIGARKKDISRVFNAEAIIEGFSAGLLGIIVTLLISLLANMVVYHVAKIESIMRLPLSAAIILILISVFLTFIAGLVPSKIASKKDPVIALREE